MARFRQMLDNRMRTLGAMAVVMAAVGVVIGSGADFTASSANPANTFTAGTLSMSNSKSGAAILTASNLRPGGGGASGTVDIKNTGSLSGAFTLERGVITETDLGSDADPKLSSKLNLLVEDCGTGVSPDCSSGNTEVYNGTLAAFNGSGSPRALGNFAADEQHRYRFTVALDSSADDTYQGDSSEVTFTWKASS